MESEEEEENSSFSNQLRGSQSEINRNNETNRKSITNENGSKIYVRAQ